MSKCLYCSKVIPRNASSFEKESGWHQHCVHEFFGLDQMPELSLSAQEIEELAKRTVAQGLTVPGVQKKLSLHLSQEEHPRLTLVDYPSGYILKPQSPRIAFLPELEATAMKMAKSAGLHTVPFGLIRMDGQLAYITRRIDRTEDGKLAMEDFCQLCGRLTKDKYAGSYENIGRKTAEYSSRTGLDLTILFSLFVFSFMIGNSDLHLKNVSLIEEKPGSRVFLLSEIYDLLPVNLVLPEDQEEMALTVNGKKKHLHRKDFLQMAIHMGMQEGQAEKLLEQMLKKKDRILRTLKSSQLPESLKNDWTELIEQRTRTLEKKNR